MSDPLIKLAREMYENMPTPKPAWEQLESSGACQQVWIARARQLLYAKVPGEVFP